MLIALAASCCDRPGLLIRSKLLLGRRAVTLDGSGSRYLHVKAAKVTMLRIGSILGTKCLILMSRFAEHSHSNDYFKEASEEPRQCARMSCVYWRRMKR
eukprot:1192262-Prorocentrum_minimum.AAC.1